MKKIIITFICIFTCILYTGIAHASKAFNEDCNCIATTDNICFEISEVNIQYISNDVKINKNDIIIDNKTNSIFVNFSNFYPGATVEFDVVIKNTGDISICLNEIIQEKVKICDTETSQEVISNNISECISIICTVSSKESESINYCCDNENNLNFISIESDEIIVLNVKILMSRDACNNTMGKSFQFKILPQFIQY